MPSPSQSDRAQTLAWLRATPPGKWAQLGRRQHQQLDLLGPDESSEAMRQLEEWSNAGFGFLTLLDDDYPANLRRHPSSPPFLFVRGTLSPDDQRSAAIVGTRNCTEDGRKRSLKLARALAEAGVTVVSGLALGIDTAAHQGALAARGRTLAVVGTGLETIYPPQNRDLHDRIVDAGGAVLSQFWPDFKAVKGGANFLARNRSMANLSLATVVVEASFRSGARSQAVHAQKTGGTVLLLRSLVDQEEWARALSQKPGCFVVAEMDEVLEHLARGSS